MDSLKLVRLVRSLDKLDDLQLASVVEAMFNEKVKPSSTRLYKTWDLCRMVGCNKRVGAASSLHHFLTQAGFKPCRTTDGRGDPCHLWKMDNTLKSACIAWFQDMGKQYTR